jgi:hypothetical protein
LLEQAFGAYDEKNDTREEALRSAMKTLAYEGLVKYETHISKPVDVYDHLTNGLCLTAKIERCCNKMHIPYDKHRIRNFITENYEKPVGKLRDYLFG